MVDPTDVGWETFEVAETFFDVVTFIATCFIVLLPFWFYWYLWNHPAKWVAWCGPDADPCEKMAQIAHVMKFLQISVIGLQSVWRWPSWLCILAIISGQVLNYRVYQLLGTSGVYYGQKFGKADIPWVTAFPFNVMKDPQYVGSVLSLLGCLCWAPWPYIALWIAGYAFMVVLERDAKTVAKGKRAA
eukprot:jgi/Mesen1/2717/ME000168S01794